MAKHKTDFMLVDVCSALVKTLSGIEPGVAWLAVMKIALPQLRTALKAYEHPAAPLTDLPLPTIEKPRRSLSSLNQSLPGIGTFGAARKTSSGPKWKDSEVRWILTNPVYIGIGPYPVVVSKELWVGTAIKLLEDHGPAQFFVNLLHALSESFPTEENDAENKN